MAEYVPRLIANGHRGGKDTHRSSVAACVNVCDCSRMGTCMAQQVHALEAIVSWTGSNRLHLRAQLLYVIAAVQLLLSLVFLSVSSLFSLSVPCHYSVL